MLRQRETIKRWHKAFIWVLLAGLAKAAVAGAKVAGTAAKFVGAAASKGVGMLAKGAKTLGKAGVDTAWSAGEKVVGGIINPAEKAFEAFKEGGIKGGIKEMGKQLVDSSDIGKSIDLIKGANDFLTPNANAQDNIAADAAEGTQVVPPPAAEPTPPAPGILGGLKESFLGLDSTRGNIPEESIGRKTAYGIGSTLGSTLRNRLGASNTSSESYTASYRQDLVSLADKGIEDYSKEDWDAMRDAYPTNKDQIDKLELEYTPVTTNPEFKNEGGVGAWLSKNKAKVTSKAQSMIDAIKSEGDLQEYKKSVKDKIKAGIWKGGDHKILREYYGF